MRTVRTKTFWGGVAAIATGIGLMVSGAIPEGINAIMAGVLAIFIRDGVAKVERRG